MRFFVGLGDKVFKYVLGVLFNRFIKNIHESTPPSLFIRIIVIIKKYFQPRIKSMIMISIPPKLSKSMPIAIK